jgi:hypothetical protein
MKTWIFVIVRAFLLGVGIVGLHACFEEEYVGRGPGYGRGYGYRYESPWHEFKEEAHEHGWHHHDDDDD